MRKLSFGVSLMYCCFAEMLKSDSEVICIDDEVYIGYIWGNVISCMMRLNMAADRIVNHPFSRNCCLGLC